jgi:hypothetical protein
MEGVVMNNTSFFKTYTNYEILKYQFENGFNANKSYISGNYNYSPYSERQTIDDFEFNCCECHETYPVSELTFNNGKIICKCGAKFAPEDLKPGIQTWVNRVNQFKMHNLKNDTFNRVSVPTVINGKYFYCSKCRETHELKDMPIENKQRLCSCGELYSFDEVKVMNLEDHMSTFGDVFFDNNKITMAFSKYYSTVNGQGVFYWQDGRQRLTMNLETGFSYMTNTGHCYRIFNDYYRKNHNGKNAPKMYNCTYSCTSNDTLVCVANAKAEMLIKKYSQYTNLAMLIEKRNYTLKQIIFDKLLKQMDKYMTEYYNNKFSYRIKSFEECVGEPKNVVRELKGEWRRSLINMYDSHLLILHNRFINLNYKDLKYTALDIINNIQWIEEKRNYKKLPREANNIGLEYICNSVGVSKKLRKKVAAFLETGEGMTYDRLSDKAYTFVNICKSFKNKENINKIFDSILSASSRDLRARYDANEATMNLWLNYRNETYISNCSPKELSNKIDLMDDSRRMIINIRNVFGEDWDLNSIKFYNEQQFHDDLVRITTSEDYIYLLNKEKDERQIKPFEMEDDIYELEEVENDIYIARNRAILTNIGTAMGICVGGYGGSVESGRCRIAYIKENGIYKVCLELSKHKNKETNKYEYTIVQAKLQYNGLCVTEEVYFNKVKEWAERNNIAIDTSDMNVKNSKQRQLQAVEF